MNVDKTTTTSSVDGWKCPQCKTIWSPSLESCKTCKPPVDWQKYYNDRGMTPCGTEFDVSKCPCQPANGGSGICGCVRGGSNVTCTT